MGKKEYIQKPLPFGEMTNALNISCKGEMLIGDEAKDLIAKIPLNPLATPEMIKALKHEKEPLDCVFTVDYRQGGNGTYADSAFESIANKILTSPVFVPACYGHQSQEAFYYEGREIYGSVIGVLLDKVNEKIHYRIIPDKGDHAEKIRRWLKNKQINAVSIWGIPTYDSTGAMVIDYNLRSIDFVPPFTEGQKNSVHVGEMDVSHSELHDKLRIVLNEKYKNYVYSEEIYDDYVIAEKDNQLYKIPYSLTDDKVNLGAAKKVRRITKYEPMEVEMENITNVTNDELLAEITKRTKDGRMSALAVAGEMNLKLEDTQKVASLEASVKEFDELKKAAGEMSIADAISIAKKAKETEKSENEKKAFGEMVETVKVEKGLIKDGKPTGEMAAMVDKFARLEQGMTKEQIAGEMDRVINDADIQKMVQAKAAQEPIGEMGNKTGGSEKTVITF
ncbi:hypothetical protein [Treponema putidum]|uniref:hypothetical protein n=1 Tax=Treponema putidum TaxID=221027 RepID=UPI003D8FF8BB